MAARRKAVKRRARAKKRRPAGAPFQLPEGWTLDRGGKSMSFRVRTADFLEAVAIINAVAPVAEELEHHPDFHLEEWNKLRITTWSHDAGGLTARDLRLARRINEVLAGRWPSTG
ncbi:MAG TPA: 4a-hydroxytetrahydrobiopterin dehydratase [Candidatus Thermoplasmatota archaeon]